jgi:hypothetical protein
MAERENTLVCTFDAQSRRITAYDIHECIYETMHLEGTDVAMVQVDGPRQQVYIKFKEYRRMQETLLSTNGQGEFRHSNGVISKVRIETARLGIRRVRIANLPPPRNFRQRSRWAWADTGRSKRSKKKHSHAPTGTQWLTAFA